jgi:hypothetical protein
MTMHKLKLVPLPGLYAICRLHKDASVPAWASLGEFLSITRTAKELSVVCSQSLVPDEVRCERGWRCLGVAGTMDFSMIGVAGDHVRDVLLPVLGVPDVGPVFKPCPHAGEVVVEQIGIHQKDDTVVVSLPTGGVPPYRDVLLGPFDYRVPQ